MVKILSNDPLKWLARTKFHPPKLRGDGIRRQRLIGALYNSLTTHPLTLLSAQAGYGKTTFIKILAGSASSDSGRIKWQRGQDVYVEGAIDDFIYYNQVLDKLDLNDTVSHALNFIGIAHRAPGKKVNRFPVQA